MAYSNWGAFVYKNGERRTDKEDVGVWDTDESDLPSGVRIFANIIKNRESGSNDFSSHSHHAVLGDGNVRLCGYKDYPLLYTILNGKSEKIPLPFDYDDQSEDTGVIEDDNGELYEWSYQHNGINRIYLRLKEPDGSIWTSTCGYEFGAGHVEE